MKTVCIIFDGYKDRNGYGQQSVNGKLEYAHRTAYAAVHGHIPRGLVVRHMCHNPSCINPEHLKIGTQLDNVRDMDTAGRRKSPWTLLHSLILLAQGMVTQGMSQRRVAAYFGISQSTLSRSYK